MITTIVKLATFNEVVYHNSTEYLWQHQACAEILHYKDPMHDVDAEVANLDCNLLVYRTVLIDCIVLIKKECRYSCATPNQSENRYPYQILALLSFPAYNINKENACD